MENLIFVQCSTFLMILSRILLSNFQIKRLNVRENKHSMKNADFAVFPTSNFKLFIRPVDM